MPQRSGISQRRFVQLGGGVAAIGLAGGFASADNHDEDDSDSDDGTDGSSEDSTSEDGGTANVRVAHLSPDAPAVDETGDALFESVEFGDSSYAEVPAGSYRLCVYPAGEREEAVLGVDVETTGGTVSSAFATGYVMPDDAPADETFDIVLPPIRAATWTTTDDGRRRLIVPFFRRCTPLLMADSGGYLSLGLLMFCICPPHSGQSPGWRSPSIRSPQPAHSYVLGRSPSYGSFFTMSDVRY